MPRRDSELPEGTDKIVAGAASNGTDSNGGFVATRSAGTGARDASDKLVRQVKDQVSTLRGQAGEKLRTYADDGKGKGANLLDEISGVIEDAARSIEQRLGADYGDYAHRAAGAVSDFAGKVRDKSVDDIVDDGKSIVRKSPVIAIAAAAVVGFALVRVLRTGFDGVTGAQRGEAANDGD